MNSTDTAQHQALSTTPQNSSPQGEKLPAKVDTSQIAMRTVGGGSMFVPRSMQEVVDFSTMMAKAGPALPPAWRGNPGLCMATTMQSLRWEMDPFAVVQKQYVTKDKGGNERIAFEAQLIAAVVNTRAPIVGRLRVEYEGEGPSRRCIVSATFKGDNKPTVLRTPPLSQIGVKNSPLWTSDPDQQLAYYAQRAWGRRHCPEVLMGVYTPDEVAGMEGYDAQDITPLPSRGQSIVAAAAQLGAPPARPPAQPPHDPDTGEIIEDGETEDAAPADNDRWSTYLARMVTELHQTKPDGVKGLDATFQDTIAGAVERGEIDAERAESIRAAWGGAVTDRGKSNKKGAVEL